MIFSEIITEIQDMLQKANLDIHDKQINIEDNQENLYQLIQAINKWKWRKVSKLGWSVSED